MADKDIPVRSYADALKIAKDAGASTTITYYPSLLTHVPRCNSFFQRMAGCPYKERSAILGDYFNLVSRGAAPTAGMLWLHSPTFFNAATNALTDDITRPLDQIYENFVNGEVGTKDSLRKYKTAATAFRKNLRQELNYPEFLAIEGRTVAEVFANQSVLTYLNKMLEIMKKQRAKRLASGGAVKKPCPAYVDDFIFWLENPTLDYIGRVPIDKRQATFRKEAIRLPGEDDRNFNGRGFLLLSTAIAYHTQKRDSAFIDKINVPDNSLVQTAVNEAKLLVAGLEVQEASLFQQQIAAADIIFNTFYWLKKLGVLDRNAYKLVNKFMYIIGTAPIGTKKRAELVKTSRSSLIRKFSDFTTVITNIYTPPFICTYGRFDDMIPVMGSVCVTDFEKSLHKQASSRRNNINMRLDADETLRIVTDLFALEEIANCAEGANIYRSCHLLHQLLFSKKSPYEYAANKIGNALQVRFYKRGSIFEHQAKPSTSGAVGTSGTTCGTE
ncbi:uncharacterized protein LOC111614595 [Centruroides sculpturatus]|uniref:uncharacterized protein LOC111614595 n=1 Tax=Centruroides sculpturatus TaxID=218467 RepID=UPI000C6CCF26|nr:uncharacterized protein LOC111614595 [Centruroides sculpturatus]